MAPQPPRPLAKQPQETLNKHDCHKDPPPLTRPSQITQSTASEARLPTSQLSPYRLSHTAQVKMASSPTSTIPNPFNHTRRLPISRHRVRPRSRPRLAALHPYQLRIKTSLSPLPKPQPLPLPTGACALKQPRSPTVPPPTRAMAPTHPTPRTTPLAACAQVLRCVVSLTTITRSSRPSKLSAVV